VTTPAIVMAVRDTATYVLARDENVDARLKAGHDG
jgi:hypothetical protein